MAFFFSCIYLTMLVLRPQEWFYPELWPESTLNYIVFCGVLMVTGDILMRRTVWPKRLPHLWLLIGFFCAALLSDVVFTNFGNLTRTFMEFLKAMVIFVLLLLSCTTANRIRIACGVFVVIALVITYHCHLQVTTGFGFAGAEPLYHGGAGITYARAQYFGIMGDPNDTSLYLTFAIPLTFVLFRRRHLVAYLLMALIPLFLVYGVVLTQSRGGYIAMALMIFAVVLRYTHSRRLIIGMIAAGIILMLALPNRLASLGIADQDRTFLWGEANQVFKAHPLTGVGANRIVEYVGRGKVPHNSFVHVYSELGVIGYTFWFSLFFFSVYGCWCISNLKPDEDDEEEKMLITQARGIFASLVGFAGAAYFLSRAYYVPLFVLLALAAAVYQLSGFRIGMVKLNHYSGFHKDRLWFYPAISVASIFFIYLSILLFNRIS